MMSTAPPTTWLRVLHIVYRCVEDPGVLCRGLLHCVVWRFTWLRVLHIVYICVEDPDA